MLSTVQQGLTDALVEREEETYCAMLALVANEHLLLVGPPGTAKSLLCHMLGQAISGATVFDRLLGKFSTPEELFGPYRLSQLKADVFERATAGYLPEAHVAFIDEIWNASSAILNTLLRLMNERTFENGTGTVQCPLRLMVAASNLWPIGEGREDLGAAFDRFLIRKAVKPVSARSVGAMVFDARPTIDKPLTTLADLDNATDVASKLPVSTEAREAFGQIVSELHGNGISPGDRRLVKSIKVARAAAYLDGASDVQPEHLEPLKYVLWSEPTEHPARAGQIITKISNPAAAEVQAILSEADGLLATMEATNGNMPEQIAALKKLDDCVKRAKKVKTDRGTKAVDFLSAELLKHKMKHLDL